MITVGMNYNVKPGKQQEFEQKFDAVLVAIRSATGHVTSKLFRDVADDTAYLAGFTLLTATAVPEPASLAVFGIGLTLCLSGRRRTTC